MSMRSFFRIFRDLFLPQPRNACPHCGGVRCIGVCQFDKKEEEKSSSAPEINGECHGGSVVTTKNDIK
ncbi:hypothetical protein [Desulfovibrio sp. MES5]|uniref:hypothetical protein n=1 Tax=Desulfovibrio sp. MES5 TaxID=1899016 RepID=UPI0025C30E29|nr:hypothetical protein [Desulfovibrio sp. MES5]